MAALSTALILGLTAAAGGLGLQAYGTSQSVSAAKQSAQYNQQIAASQQRQEALRQQQMELDARRRQRESIRQAQRARSIALAAANNQGAQFGSGLPGGFGQVSGEMNTQLLGVQQALQLGRENFGESQNISNARYGLAGTQSQAAFGAGLSSLGGALIQSMGQVERLSGGFGPSTNQGSGASYNPYYGSGSSYGAIY